MCIRDSGTVDHELDVAKSDVDLSEHVSEAFKVNGRGEYIVSLFVNEAKRKSLSAFNAVTLGVVSGTVERLELKLSEKLADSTAKFLLSTHNPKNVANFFSKEAISYESLREANKRGLPNVAIAIKAGLG